MSKEAMKQAIIVEASIQMTGHPSKDARWFAKSVYEYFMAEQPAQPARVPLTDVQKQEIHNETGASVTLIRLVELYITEGNTWKPR